MQCAKIWTSKSDLNVNEKYISQFQKTCTEGSNALEFLTLKPKLLIVGNSTYLTGLKKGEFIDKFDNILRINTFNIEKLSEDIGKKTTHVAFNFCRVLHSNFAKYSHLPFFTDFSKWHTQLKYFLNKKHKYYRNLKIKNKLKNKKWNHFKMSKHLMRYYGFNWKKKPSTGFHMIMYYLQKTNMYDVYIINFGYGKLNININGMKASKNHNFDKELKLINKLNSENKIKFLT